jgi:GT2 family glycosyltransferase
MMDTLHTGGILIGGNNLIRASALKAAGGYNTDIKFYGEDTDTARRISMQGKIIFSKECIVRTSARRFKAEGTAKISAFYLYHFIKVGVLPAIGLEKLTQSTKKTEDELI